MPNGKEIQSILDISQFVPDPILKEVAAFLGLKDLSNFALVSKKFNKISTEVINELKKYDPKSIHEINAIMVNKFPFFKEVFTYRQNITKTLIDAPWNIDKVNSEVTPLIQTNIKSKAMRLSKKTAISLCCFGITLILVGGIWTGIDVANKKGEDNSVVGKGVFITMGAICLFGAAYAIKVFHSHYKRITFAKHSQNPTYQIITPAEKQKSEPKIQGFFQKRAEFFNALSSEAKSEVVMNEVQEQSKNILNCVGEIYSWVAKENKLSPEMAEMMGFYCQKLNEFSMDGTIKYDELPKFIQEIMEAYKTAPVNDEVIIPMHEKTEKTSSLS